MVQDATLFSLQTRECLELLVTLILSTKAQILYADQIYRSAYRNRREPLRDCSSSLEVGCHVTLQTNFRFLSTVRHMHMDSHGSCGGMDASSYFGVKSPMHSNFRGMGSEYPGEMHRVRE